jgi:hypothetical protein
LALQNDVTSCRDVALADADLQHVVWTWNALPMAIRLAINALAATS